MARGDEKGKVGKELRAGLGGQRDSGMRYREGDRPGPKSDLLRQ